MAAQQLEDGNEDLLREMVKVFAEQPMGAEIDARRERHQRIPISFIRSTSREGNVGHANLRV